MTEQNISTVGAQAMIASKINHARNTLLMKLREEEKIAKEYADLGYGWPKAKENADEALLAFIDDDEVREVYETIERWYA